MTQEEWAERISSVIQEAKDNGHYVTFELTPAELYPEVFDISLSVGDTDAYTEQGFVR